MEVVEIGREKLRMWEVEKDVVIVGESEGR